MWSQRSFSALGLDLTFIGCLVVEKKLAGFQNKTHNTYQNKVIIGKKKELLGINIKRYHKLFEHLFIYM